MRSAGKDPIEGNDALAVLDGMTDLYVAKGRKVVHVDLTESRPGDEELLSMMLGRSGKLRAPALRTGTTVVVGFNADVLSSALV